jgi:FHA domain-containing protein
MPALTLQVVSIDAAPVGQPTLHAFDDGGGSIGRDETNFLALPDKHRRVSRLHATISFPGGMPTITNSSTSLPLSVGEQQLDGGESMPITQGALIEIGPYILQAHVGASARVATPPMPPVGEVRRDILPTFMPVGTVAAPPSQAIPVAIDLAAVDPLSNWGLPHDAIASSPLARPSESSAAIGLADLLPDQRQAAGAPPAIAPSPLSASYFAAPSSRSEPQPRSAADADPFADLLAGIGGSPGQPSRVATAFASVPQQTQAGMSADPLAAFGGAVPLVTPQGNTLLASSQGRRGNGAAESGGLSVDSFNPFHMPSSAGRNAADPLADLIGGSPTTGNSSSAESSGTPSIDSLFQSGGSSSSDAALFGFAPTARGGDVTIQGLIRTDAESDPLSLFDSLEPIPASIERPMRDNSSEVGSAFTPPLANLPGTLDRSNQSAFPAAAAMAAALPVNALALPVGAYIPAPPPPTVYAPRSGPSDGVGVASVPVAVNTSNPASAVLAPAVPIAAASPDALTEAFLRGAGLAASALPQGLTPEIMTIIGSLLRSATAGAVDMLAARAATKREVQASVTIISVQANNPLKFLPNADAALLQLLGKKMPGFMRADVAMRDAFDDLRAHEVGVIAGTRAALTEVLGKFDPAVLGDKLAKGSVLESLMPSARKAKLWDMYLERYLQIRREAEDDFQSIFGRAFVQAYERETARIKGESPMAGGE